MTSFEGFSDRCPGRRRRRSSSLSAVVLGCCGGLAIACSGSGSEHGAPASSQSAAAPATARPGGEPATRIEGPLNEIVFSGEEKTAHVVAGDDFSIVLGSVMFDCEPRAELDDSAIVAEGMRSVVTPSFPTPLRTFVMHFHAKAPGSLKLEFACSEQGSNSKKGTLVATVPITVLRPEDAEPFVDVSGSSGLPDATVAAIRTRAAKCFASELERDPRARGSLSVGLSMTRDGARMVVQTAGAAGLSESLASCARAAISSAFPIAPPLADGPSTGRCSLRFTMRPRAAAPR